MPMSNEELAGYFERLKVSPLGRDLVSKVRSEVPARRVSPAVTHNKPCRYVSPKMGATIGVESDEELTYAVLCEYDEEVIEFWEQPVGVQLEVTARNGQSRRTSYTPDFLILKRSAIEFVQVKTKDEVNQLLARNPNRWMFVGGVVRDLAADKFFAGYGVYHAMVSNGQASKLRANNYRLLMRAAEQAPPRNIQALAQRIIEHLEARSVSTIASLLEAIGTPDASVIYQMVHAGKLAADLDACRLDRVEECPLALDREILKRYLATMEWRIRSDSTSWAHLSPLEAVEAYSRLQQLQHEVPAKRSPRTLRRWRSRLANSNNDPFCLAPRIRFRGNRTPRLSSMELELIEQAIRTYYLTNLSPTVYSCYGQYCLDVEAQIRKGLIPRSTKAVSYPTFLKFCRRQDPESTALARGGRRFANAHRPPVAPELKSLKQLRPFERAHIDHYTCDLHVVVAPGRKDGTKRPWLTLMRDEATGTVLAMSLSFLAPSRRSCMSVVRDCVRRHQRLPEMITVDNGKEFDSAYFELLLARYRVSKQSRPPGAPRFGASIERVFGNLKSFLAGLPGNTTNDARGRGVSRAFRGQKHAALDCHAAHAAIECYLFEHFNRNAPANRFCSPEQMLISAMKTFPFSGRIVAFDDSFLARTALPIGRLKLDPSRGVRHKNRWYFSSAILKAQAAYVEAYEEPWDLNRLYVLVNGELILCAHGPSEPGPLFNVRRTVESMLALECADVLSRLRRSKAKDMAVITRSVIRAGDRRSLVSKSVESRTLPPKADSIARLEVVMGDGDG